MKWRKANHRSRRQTLGSFSADTKGDNGPHWEASGLQRVVGIANE